MSGEPRLLLMRLSIRESSRGNPYLIGFLGAARVIAFKGKEPDKYGNEVCEVYIIDQQSIRSKLSGLPVRGQGTWDRVRELTGETREYRNERRDPRQEYAEELASRFDERGPDRVDDLW